MVKYIFVQWVKINEVQFIIWLSLEMSWWHWTQHLWDVADIFQGGWKKMTASLFIWLAIIRLKAIHPRYSSLLWKDVETICKHLFLFPLKLQQWDSTKTWQSYNLWAVDVCVNYLRIFSKLSSLMSSREQLELTCWATPHITTGEVTTTPFFILYYKTPATKIESIKYRRMQEVLKIIEKLWFGVHRTFRWNMNPLQIITSIFINPKTESLSQIWQLRKVQIHIKEINNSDKDEPLISEAPKGN